MFINKQKIFNNDQPEFIVLLKLKTFSYFTLLIGVTGFVLTTGITRSLYKWDTQEFIPECQYVTC